LQTKIRPQKIVATLLHAKVNTGSEKRLVKLVHMILLLIFDANVLLPVSFELWNIFCQHNHHRKDSLKDQNSTITEM